MTDSVEDAVRVTIAKKDKAEVLEFITYEFLKTIDKQMHTAWHQHFWRKLSEIARLRLEGEEFP